MILAQYNKHPCCILCSRGINLERDFEIIYDCFSVGHVWVARQGLYYNIKCCIWVRGLNKPHLIAKSESGETDLGVCLRYKHGFCLERILPIKSVGTELQEFYIQQDHTISECIISENMPFVFLEKLNSAVLLRCNEQVIIVFK